MAAVVNVKIIGTAIKTCKYVITKSTSSTLTVLSCIDLCGNIYTLVKESYTVLQDISDDDKDDVMQNMDSLQENLERIRQVANDSEKEIKSIHLKLEKAKKKLDELENFSRMKWYKKILSFEQPPKEKFNSIKCIINSVIQIVTLIMARLNVDLIILEQKISTEQANIISELGNLKKSILEQMSTEQAKTTLKLGNLEKLILEQNQELQLSVEQAKATSELEKIKSEVGNLKQWTLEQNQKICIEQEKTKSELKSELGNLKRPMNYCITFICVVLAILLFVMMDWSYGFVLLHDN